MFRHRCRRAVRHEHAALIAAIRTQFNDLVTAADHIKVALGYQDGMVLSTRLHPIDQPAWIKGTQARAEFVNPIEAFIPGLLGELECQHQPLGFRQNGGGPLAPSHLNPSAMTLGDLA